MRWGALNGALVFMLAVPGALWLAAQGAGAAVGALGEAAAALGVAPARLVAAGAQTVSPADVARAAEAARGGAWGALLGALLGLVAGALGGTLGTRALLAARPTVTVHPPPAPAGRGRPAPWPPRRPSPARYSPGARRRRALAECDAPAVALVGTAAPAWLPQAAAFRRVVVALDADAAGDAAAEGLLRDAGAVRPQRGAAAPVGGGGGQGLERRPPRRLR